MCLADKEMETPEPALKPWRWHEGTQGRTDENTSE